MGLDVQTLRALLAAKNLGANFIRTATLGRQDLNMDANETYKVFNAFGHHLTGSSSSSNRQNTLTTDLVLNRLGAQQVRAVDNSDYEGASIVMDLGKPISDDYEESFSFVWDGGTLEHVFEFPTALKNCMRMVEKDGHLLIATVANGFCGHGFYQFSPELFYRTLNESNGFSIEFMCFADAYGGNFFSIEDPEQMKTRLNFSSVLSTYLFVLAKRRAIVPIFERPVYQSDYAAKWDRVESNGQSLSQGLWHKLSKRIVSPKARTALKSVFCPFRRFGLTEVYPERVGLKQNS